MYEYITLRRERFCVHAMCRVVKVSESGYYRSLQSAGKPKPWQLLLVKIREIYNENPDNDNYGVGRILLALTQRGIAISRSSVRRAMKREGLPSRSSSLQQSDKSRLGCAEGGEPDSPGFYRRHP
ncbi:putative transposase orfB for insertion sequence element [Oscillibacter valericigenes Sjm18-20]|nr:putative transposase orfB for insertion sequence element [Oscillibacter valericigenes Sjm18-20]